VTDAVPLEILHLSRDLTDPETFHHHMRADPVFAAKVRYSCDHSIPWTVFNGRTWPNPRDPREPQWLDDDRELAVAWVMWSAQLCPGCGLHPLDWPNERDETHKGVIDVCWGCLEVEDTRASIPEGKTPGEQRRRSATRVRLQYRDPNEKILLDAREAGLVDDE
jgi:hypothetical protein